MNQHAIRGHAYDPAADLKLRPAAPTDAEEIGRVTYEAFRQFHESRGFTPDFPSVEAAAGLAAAQIADPRTFGVVAVSGDKIVGANFLSEGDPIRGVGPIAVDPQYQGRGLGRLLMQAVVERGRGAAGIRLVQDAFNGKTLALYTTLGFVPREPLALLDGSPRDLPSAGNMVRPMVSGDIEAASELCRSVHGLPRTAELEAAVMAGTALVLEREGRIVASMTNPGLWQLNHAVAEDEAALREMILGAGAATGAPLGFLVPIRRAALFNWCLEQGLRVVKPMTLMSIGAYCEPTGGYLPSVFY